MEIISSKQYKARKVHKCDWCSGDINIGQKYNYLFCKHYTTYPWRNHIHCSDLAFVLGWLDEGALTQEDFVEYVNNEFNHLDIEEKKVFSEKLDLVLKHYKIEKLWKNTIAN